MRLQGLTLGGRETPRLMPEAPALARERLAAPIRSGWLRLLFSRLALTAMALGTLSACSGSGPREIAYGEEMCEFCRMTITDPRHGAQVQTAHGRIQAFDAIECAAGFALTLAPGDIQGVWVIDNGEVGQFVPVDGASFWRTSGASTPMGSGLVATTDGQPPAGLTVLAGPLKWDDVLELVKVDGLRGAAAMEAQVDSTH